MKTRCYLIMAGLLLAALGRGVCQQPIITKQPQPQTIKEGAAATFAVEASGTGPLNYQWQHAFDYVNYLNVSGGTDGTLTIANAQYSHSGDYRVVITNQFGSVLSAPARLTVVRLPVIVIQPTNFAVVSLGASVANRVFASSAATMTYQWRLSGTDLPGQTRSSIVLTNLQFSDEGMYDVVVSNFAGSVTSAKVVLKLDPTYTQINTGALVTDAAGGWNASWIDYDGDGRLDVSMAPKGDALRYTPVFHNEGNGTFRKITTNAIAQTLVQAWTHVWADYDNDGDVDLFVPNAANVNNMLFRNEGNGAFKRITSGHPVIDGSHANVGAWADYDRDGLVDLFVNATCPRLYLNQGTSGFRLMTYAEVGSIVGCVASDYAMWVDADSDGWPELYRNAVRDTSIPGWSMTNHIHHINSQGRFYLMEIGQMQRGKEGYSGITWADYDNDGFLDAASWVERGPLKLYRNPSGQGYVDATAGAFPETVKNCQVIWPGDYDNDGWQDLVVYPFIAATYPQLYHNNGNGTFSPQSVGSPTSIRSSQGAWFYMGDYNNDGFLDVLGQYGPGIAHTLFRHNGNQNHWLKVLLDGRASNRSGIGAKVRALATIGGRAFYQLREISAQGFGADNGLIAHFGLGEATSASMLRIEWPSGTVQRLYHVAANQFLTIVETPNTPPVPEIAVSPLANFPGVTNLVVISLNGSKAEVLLDGSQSHDVDNDPLAYTWFMGTNSVGTDAAIKLDFGLGSHTVALVVDDGLATGSSSVTVEVVTAAESVGIVMGMVQDSALPRSRQQPLLATLRATAASFERGNLAAGLNQLHAFQNKVRAQVADTVLADQLTEAAQVIMDVFLNPRPVSLPARVVPPASAPSAAPPAAATGADSPVNEQ